MCVDVASSSGIMCMPLEFGALKEKVASFVNNGILKLWLLIGLILCGADLVLLRPLGLPCSCFQPGWSDVAMVWSKLDPLAWFCVVLVWSWCGPGVVLLSTCSVCCSSGLVLIRFLWSGVLLLWSCFRPV